MDALGDHVADRLGENAALESRAAFERAVNTLFEAGEDDWRAAQAALSAVKSWTDWAGLSADPGNSDPSPGEGAASHNAEQTADADAYEVVHEGDREPMQVPVDEDGEVSVSALGFNAASQEAANALLESDNAVAVPADEYPTPGE
jgi:hypothetical protein